MANTHMFKALIMLLCCLFITACDTQERKSDMVNQHVTLKLGQQGEDSFRKAHGTTDKHTAPSDLVGFTELDWSTPPYGQVTVDHAGHKILFPYTLYVLGSSWSSDAEDGISGLDLRSGISEPEFIRHQEAWERWQALLKHFLDNGWQFYINERSARVSGAEAYRYSMSDQTAFAVIDPRYELNYAQWQDLLNRRRNAISVDFYQNGVYMSVTLNKEVAVEDLFAEKKLDLNPDEWGQYTINTEFNTVRYAARNGLLTHFTPEVPWPEEEPAEYENISRAISQDLLAYWQKYQAEAIEASSRAEEEEKAIQRGFKIDTSYQNPDITPYLQSKPVF